MQRWISEALIGVRLVGVLMMFGIGTIIIAEAEGRHYYVDSENGQDNGPGTITAPWKTIAHVSISRFGAGDHIYFKRGCEWREELDISSIGLPNDPMVYGAYGDGPNPVIRGDDPIDDSAWEFIPSLQVIEFFETLPYLPPMDNIGVWRGSSLAPEGTRDTHLNFGFVPLPYTGNYCWQMTSEQITYFEIDERVGPIDEINIGVLARSPNDNSQRGYICSLVNAQGAPLLDVLWASLADTGHAESRLLCINALDNNQTAWGATPIVPNTWYWLQVHYLRKGNEGTLTVTLNGIITEFDRQGDWITGDSPVKHIHLGSRLGSAEEHTMYFDNIRLETPNEASISCYRAPWEGSQHKPSAGHAHLYDDGVDMGFAQANVQSLANQGDWCINEATNRLYYVATTNPTNIEVSRRNNAITVTTSSSDEAEQCSHIRIENLDCMRTINQTLDLRDCRDVTISSCTIHHSGYAGAAITAGAIFCRIESCEFYQCEHAAVFLNENNGAPPHYITLRNNYVHDCYLEGLMVEQSSGTVDISGNIIKGTKICPHTGLYGHGIMIEGGEYTTDVRITNNLILNSEGYNILLGGTSDDSRLVVRNNISILTTDNSTSQCLAAAASIAPLVDMDYNCYWRPQGTIIAAMDNIYSTAPSSFALYQEQSGWDQHSVVADPQLDETTYVIANPEVLWAGTPEVFGYPRHLGPLLPHYAPGDLDQDGMINLADFAVFAEKWLQGP